MANIVIVIYSMYHHVATMAEAVKKGIEESGNTATIYQVEETLNEEILNILHAPAKPNYPIATPEILVKSDGIIFGFPTRFGNLPSQMKSFIDSTGGLWQEGKLYHKPASAFISTGTASGRETTIFSLLSTFSHHGMIYVPLGFATVFGELTDLSEPVSASPWGAGTVAGSDGSRSPTERELKIAQTQGKDFAITVGKFAASNSGKSAESKPAAATTTKPAAKSAKPAAKPAAKTEQKEEKKNNPIRRFFSKIFN